MRYSLLSSSLQFSFQESQAPGPLPLQKETCRFPASAPGLTYPFIFFAQAHRRTHAHVRAHTDPSPLRASPQGFGAELAVGPSGLPRASRPRRSFPSRPRRGPLPRLPCGPLTRGANSSSRTLRSGSRPLPAPGTRLAAADQPHPCPWARGGTRARRSTHSGSRG